ncbi:MAG: hypothetical protein WAR37_02165 [Candidatus Microsaccharimonas sp.]
MTMPFTDHHLQDKIVAALVDGKKRFSDLVPEGLENSMFMYHMNKLLKKGIVQKDGDLYSLTLVGAKKYNARFRLRDPLELPILLVQYLVIEKGKVLLTRRMTTLSESLNEYMLPGGNHFFLSSSKSSATRNAKIRGLEPGEFLFTVETIAKSKRFHGIIDVYGASLKGLPQIKPEYEQVWLPFEIVLNMPFEQAGSAAFILQKYISEESSSRFTNIIG